MDRQPSVEDAIQFIVNYLREGRRGAFPQSTEYSIYLPDVIRAYALAAGEASNQVDNYLTPLSPIFYAALWELCRKGVLRPGPARYWHVIVGQHVWLHPGYSMTPYGETWVREAMDADYIPVEPSRFAQMLADRGAPFGAGFVERAQDAVRAYNAHAYLACCAMCGAAAESLILALAIAKDGHESRVLRDYASAGGRGRIEKVLLRGQPASVEAEFRRYTDLLKYWRDSASHGRAIHMTEAEAFSALILLLRFAIFAAEHQDDLLRREEVSR